MSTDPITLHIDAAVTMTDARNISVRAKSGRDALKTLRTRHRGKPFTVELRETVREHPAFVASTRYWTIGPDDEISPAEVRAADYTLDYQRFQITDPQGATHAVPGERIATLAQAFANQAQEPVALASELPGFQATTYQPESQESPEASPALNDDRDESPDPEPTDDMPGHAELGEEDEASPLPEAAPPVEEESQEVSVSEILDGPDDEHHEGDTSHSEHVPAQSASSPSSAAHQFATRYTTRADRLAPAEVGWRGALNRFFLMKVKPGRDEQEYRMLRAIIQRGLEGHRTATVINIKGGVGKSTSTFLTGATLGRTRGGNILAWDNNENSGNLADRGAVANHSNTAVDLYDQIDHLTSVDKADQLVRYVRPQGDDRFDILASQNEAADKETIDSEAFRRMHRTLSTFYSQIIVDTGNASNAKTWQAAVDVADVLVIAATNKEDGARRAFATIDALHQQGHTDKLANSVAIITQPRKPSKERLKHLVDGLGQHVRQTVVVPWDESLDEGETITWELLYPETRTAMLRATAAIVEGM